MKIKVAPFSFLVFLIPVIMAPVLYCHGFEVNTGEMLTTFFQLIWGILMALGGGLIYLGKFKFDSKVLTSLRDKKITEQVQAYSLLLIVQTLIFISVSIFYPARLYIKKQFEIPDDIYQAVGRSADSILFSLIIIPSFAALISGAWSIYLSLRYADKNTD